MFRIKICGVTQEKDARVAIDAGADAIGLNFYEKSPRCVSPELARAICGATADATRVGVFVNSTPAEMKRLASAAGLDAIQLHGDEPAELAALLAGQPVVRARRLGEDGLAAIANDLEASEFAGRRPDAVLVDAATPGAYGGTGTTIAWSTITDYREWLGQTPLILAGGLTPENVAEAIRTVRPHGVDVASGVESSPGVKDPAKVREFVQAARSALDALT